MPDVSKIRLPDSTEVNIKDSRIAGVDTTPAAGSENVVTSGGVYTAIDENVPKTYAGSPIAGGFANKAVAIPFGQVDAGSTATDIKATVDNFPETLTDGVCAYIRNNVVASASGWTLNVNGTGAKPVYNTISDATRTSTVFSAAVTYLFIYNSSRVTGGCWDMYYGYDSNTNTIGHNIRTDQMSLPTTSACYRYRLLFTSADHTHFVPANASSSTNATAKRTTTQTPINPFGSIRYYGSTTTVSSGARPSVDYIWEQYAITLGYSFNRTGAALTLTAWKPVYIKCTPQTDGSAIIDAETPYVQELPTTADGEIYIYLGVAYSATNVELTLYHPVYYHDGTSIRLWTNAPASVSVGTLDTTATTSQATSENESLEGHVTLHKVSKTGSYNDLNNKPTIPDVSQFITRSVNDLVNYYLKSEVYTKDEVATLIGAIQQFHYEIAASTSAVSDPQSNVLYLIGPSGTGSDKYEEYVYSNGWVKIGDTSIDLSGYVTTEALNTTLAGYVTSEALQTALVGKQDKIDASHKLDYSLIDNTPSIPAAQVPADWNATTGVSRILNKPIIPSAPGTLITNATTAQTASAGEAMTGSIILHKVSKTGSYNDLLNKPTIPIISAITNAEIDTIMAS